jgi:hypothetical protein
MKPLSQEAVKRLALSHGGKLEIDGSRVNSARLQVVTKPSAPKVAYMPPEEKPAPVQTIEAKPDPAVREAIASIDNYAASQFLLNDQTIQTMNAIKDMLKAQADKVGDKRPTEWVFSVKRDTRTNLIESITAKAK